LQLTTLTQSEEHPMTDSTAYFESVATTWNDIRQDLFPDDLRDKALDAFALRPGALAADLGAGTGFLTEGLLERGLRVLAVDQSPAMLAELEARLGARTELETRQGSAEALPIADGEVDYVFSNMFLHHVEDPAAALVEMARILAPGGRLVLTDLDAHQHEFLRTEQHDRWLGFERSDVLAWLAAAGFEDAAVRDTRDTCCSSSACAGEEARIGVFLASATKPGGGEAADPAERDEALRQAVRRRYAQAARQAASGKAAGCGCGCGTPGSDNVGGEIESLISRGHYEGETADLPPTAVEASLGCANPVALADLRPGETVLDLGSGGGIDVILSARRVGPEGRVYGLDMTDEMLDLARRNVAEAGLDNVELLRGILEEVPLPADSVDVVLSNCVADRRRLAQPRALRRRPRRPTRFSVLFATFGLTYRYAMWLQRPPTGCTGGAAGRRSSPRLAAAQRRHLVARVGSDVLANRFILRRSRLRGLTHLLIMWGCLLAVAITFPLVFGWLYFRPVPGDLSLYEAVVFGFPAFRFRTTRSSPSSSSTAWCGRRSW
jgi:arsenite methyltransferase